MELGARRPPPGLAERTRKPQSLPSPRFDRVFTAPVLSFRSRSFPQRCRMPHDIPKAYDPRAIEARWADFWLKEKLFVQETPESGAPPVFTMLLPPPNVTGRLHMGHMLNQTQMDIIVRWHRMRGFQTLWLPGTDHAGIATQMMVERQLESEGKDRRALGREAFV